MDWTKSTDALKSSKNRHAGAIAGRSIRPGAFISWLPGKREERIYMKLNTIVENNHVKAYGFKALVDFASTSKNNANEVIVSALSPAVMAEMGIHQYYAPILTRGVVLNTANDVKNADLDLNLVTVIPAQVTDDLKKIIVSRHQGTINILKEMYPDAEVMSGNVMPDDIKGSFVTGTLPPHLIQYAGAYSAFVIKDFDYSKDGDLSGEELKQRSHICDPITVTIA